MASAACSPVVHGGRLRIDAKVFDIKPYGAVGTPRLYPGKESHRLPFVKDNEWNSLCKHCVKIPRKSYHKLSSHQMRHIALVKAVATVEPKYSIQSDTGYRYGSNLKLDPDPNSENFQHSSDTSVELDEREKLRRMRISKANKGMVPWNKGRKHSEETRQKIRERTRIAMQDPKVKMKLVNLGHAQSDETKAKIAAGVREGWQRRREKLILQETCIFEWKNLIAESSRNGYADEGEFQWDSYGILDEKLKQEWLETIELRKKKPRPKGSKRAPKSPEQRRRISEAISAKWADPGYRERVYAALSKYHGSPVGGEKKPRRKPRGESVRRGSVKKKPTKSDELNADAKVVKDTPPKRIYTSPTFKDPMISSKLEMIKNIRAQRTAMESEKREATERAKLLIAEAEKAAKALEMAALKNPLAQTSLLETRKLIAEATRSIQRVENGKLVSQGKKIQDVPIHSTKPENPNNNPHSNHHLIHETDLMTSSEGNEKGLHFDDSTLQDELQDYETSTSMVNGHYNSTRVQSDADALQVERFKVNSSTSYTEPTPESNEAASLSSNSGESCTTSESKTKKKWICGRLVEVEED